ncbi:MAG: TlpA family protein disulfide reductase [Opitutae bacterium]|nr:TlpA family protein disulfide reductase [Opitutae bacterium]
MGALAGSVGVLGASILLGLVLMTVAAPSDGVKWSLHPYRFEVNHGGGSFSVRLTLLAVLFLGAPGLLAASWFRLRHRSPMTLLRLAALTLAVVAGSVGVYRWSRTESADFIRQRMPELRVEFLSERPDTTGKVLLVEFWATWCGPCVANIPHLNALQKEFGPDGLVVIGISGEDDCAAVEKFWRKGEMRYAVAYQEGGALQKELGVHGIPHAFLVNRRGVIVWEGHPASLSGAVLRGFLARK